jgi:hypothetical protein
LAFLKFSRDKRGVEQFCLMHTTTNRRGKVRPRVLYWYRSPPDIKVGREPFDAAVRRALEAQNPDITFDWRAIIDTPIPSADADKWRERRRAERAAKHAAAADQSPEAVGEDADPDEGIAAMAAADVTDVTDETAIGPSDTPNASPSSSATGAPAAEAQPSRDANRRRRRRVRNRGGGGPQNGTPSSSSPSDTGSSGG